MKRPPDMSRPLARSRLRRLVRAAVAGAGGRAAIAAGLAGLAAERDAASRSGDYPRAARLHTDRQLWDDLLRLADRTEGKTP